MEKERRKMREMGERAAQRGRERGREGGNIFSSFSMCNSYLSVRESEREKASERLHGR